MGWNPVKIDFVIVDIYYDCKINCFAEGYSCVYAASLASLKLD